MFVTCRQDVFANLSGKNATVDTEAAPTTRQIRDRLTSLLVTGVHRVKRHHLRRTKEEMERLRRLLVNHQDDETEKLLAEWDDVATEAGVKVDLTKKMLLNIKEVLDGVRPTEYVTMTEFKEIDMKIDDISDDPGIHAELLNDVRTQREIQFKRSKERIAALKKELKSLKAQGKADKDRDVEKVIKSIKTLDENTGSLAQNQFNSTDYKKVTEIDIRRCQTCLSVRRFPIMLTQLDGTFTIPVGCTCLDEIQKFIFMPDMLESHLTEAASDRNLWPSFNKVLSALKSAFLSMPTKRVFKLQFIYLAADAFRKIQVIRPDINVTPTDVTEELGELADGADINIGALDATSDPFAAVAGYTRFTDNNELDADDIDLNVFAITGEDILQPQAATDTSGWFGMLTNFGRNLANAVPNPMGAVRQANGKYKKEGRTLITRREIYTRIKNSLDAEIAATFMDVTVASEIWVKSIDGNSRYNLTVDATITLKKVEQMTEYIVIAPSDRTQYIDLMKDEMNLLSADQSLLLSVQSIDEILWGVENQTNSAQIRIVKRALVVDDALNHPKSLDVTHRYSLLFQRLHQDGMIIFANCTPADDAIKNLCMTYSFPGQSYKLMIEAAKATLSIENKNCVACFYSKREGKVKYSSIDTCTISSVTRSDENYHRELNLHDRDQLLPAIDNNPLDRQLGLEIFGLDPQFAQMNFDLPQPSLEGVAETLKQPTVADTDSTSLPPLPPIVSLPPPAIDNNPLDRQLGLEIFGLDPRFAQMNFDLSQPSLEDVAETLKQSTVAETDSTFLPPLPPIVPLPTLFPPPAAPSSDGGSRLWRSGAQLDLMLRQ